MSAQRLDHGDLRNVEHRARVAGLRLRALRGPKRTREQFEATERDLATALDDVEALREEVDALWEEADDAVPAKDLTEEVERREELEREAEDLDYALRERVFPAMAREPLFAALLLTAHATADDPPHLHDQREHDRRVRDALVVVLFVVPLAEYLAGVSKRASWADLARTAVSPPRAPTNRRASRPR